MDIMGISGICRGNPSIMLCVKKKQSRRYIVPGSNIKAVLHLVA